MKRARTWRRYLRLGSSVREEVDDEVAFHLEEQARALIASGLSEEAAAAAALGLFGDRQRIEGALLEIGHARVREERRSAMLKDLRLDMRFAFRYLSRRRGFAVVAIGVLALGIGATSAVFAIVDAALLRPLPFPDGDRVVRLSDIQPDVRGVNASWPEVQDWQRGLTFLDGLAAIGTNVHILPEGDDPARVIGAHIVGDYLGVLGLPALVGRGFTERELSGAERVVMLSESLWRTRFGSSADVNGRSLRVNDDVYTIVGVMPREANILAARDDIELWLPFDPPPWATRGLHFMAVFGRIPAALSIEEANSRIEAAAQALRDEAVTEHGILVERVRDRLVADARPLLIVLAGAVVCLLLIVCANLANLFLSHAALRRGEFALRIALGAGRMRLTRQLLTESLVIALLGGVLGAWFGQLATGAVAATAQRAALLAPAGGIDLRAALFTAGVTLLAAVVVGLWPALRAGRDVAATLGDTAGRATLGRAGRRSRRVLVGAEIALSVILLAGAGLMVRSLVILLHEDPGFRAGNVLKFDLSLPGSRYGEDAQQAQFFTTLRERIGALPGVLSVGGINELPLDGGDVSGGFSIAGREFAPADRPSAKKRVVTPGYFETLGIPVLSGRVFDTRDRAGTREVVVISRSLARRYWPDTDPVGQIMSFSWGPGDEQEIIGVVGDVRHDGLAVAVEGMMYRPISQFAFPGLTFVVRTAGEPTALLDGVRAQVRSLDPALPIDDVMTLRDVVRASVSARSTLMVLLTGFAAIALLLAAVGVYAITAQSVAQRTQEIGVRKALGAQDSDVLRLVIGEEALVLGAGLALGIAGALAAMPLLATSLHGVEARDPVTLAGAAALLAAVGLLAVWLPARRASRLDPMRALRDSL
ncbi:MAG TPA: ABC transporter permease [Longimicrobiales bacterium]|nr:ABC transporter permease [Longimicrobiales bacterium]